MDRSAAQFKPETEQFSLIFLECSSGILVHQIFDPNTAQRSDFMIFMRPFISFVISLFDLLLTVYGIPLLLSFQIGCECSWADFQ